MTNQFKIYGKPFLHNFYKRIYDMAQRKMKKHENLAIDVISVKFPSPFSILIRYAVTNKDEKYEIILQGPFQEQYKRVNGDRPEPGLTFQEVETIIRQSYGDALKLTT